jgi:uncharacterized protein (TIGR02001 family)
MKLKQTVIALPALLVLGATASLLPTVAHAEDAASPISYNVGVVSDYRYRGISQSRLRPALQGGVDYANGPFYAGTWLSTIKWIKDAGGGNAPVEWDLYGGFKGDIVKDSLTYDVGALAYVYLGNSYGDIPGAKDANTAEVYGALTASVVTVKYSYAATTLFGTGDSSGSGYLEAAANFDVGAGFTLTPHVGRQRVKGVNHDAASYTDYSLTLAKDFGHGITGTVAFVGSNADSTFYYTPDLKATGRKGGVVGVKYSF